MNAVKITIQADMSDAAIAKLEKELAYRMITILDYLWKDYEAEVLSLKAEGFSTPFELHLDHSTSKGDSHGV